MIIKPSKRLYYTIGALYSGAALGNLICTLHLYLKTICIILLAISACRFFKRYIFLTHPRAVIFLRQTQEDFWEIKRLSGEVKLANIVKSSVITQFLLVLSFICHDDEKLTILLMPDSVDQQAYRRLLVCLYQVR